MRFARTVRLIALTSAVDGMNRAQATETTGEEIPCIEESIGVVENYQAMAIGVSPSLKIKVRIADYSGQQALLYEGQRYRVVRAARAEKNFMVLVGEAVGRG